MKAFLVIFSLVLSVAAQATSTPTSYVPTSAMEREINRRNNTASAYKYSLGTVVKQAHNTAVGTYDFSVNGGAAGNQAVGINLPSKAIVRKAWYDVVTAPTSASATDLGVVVQSGQDLKAYTAKASWTGRVDGALDGAVANFIKLTADRSVYLIVSGSALTAGKIKVFVDYVVSE